RGAAQRSTQHHGDDRADGLTPGCRSLVHAWACRRARRTTPCPTTAHALGGAALAAGGALSLAASGTSPNHPISLSTWLPFVTVRHNLRVTSDDAAAAAAVVGILPSRSSCSRSPVARG